MLSLRTHAWVRYALCRVTVAAGLARAADDARQLAHIAAAADGAALASTLDNPALSHLARAAV